MHRTTIYTIYCASYYEWGERVKKDEKRAGQLFSLDVMHPLFIFDIRCFISSEWLCDVWARENSFRNSWTTANSMEFSSVKSLQVALWTPSSLLHTQLPPFFARFIFCSFFFGWSHQIKWQYMDFAHCTKFSCAVESWRLFSLIRLQIRYEKERKLWTLNLKI